MHREIDALVGAVKMAGNVPEIQNLVDEVRQRVHLGELTPDLGSLSRFRRAIDTRFCEVTPHEADCRHHHIGQAKAKVIATVHDLGVLANHQAIALESEPH